MFAINVMSLDIYKRSVLKIKSETGKIQKKIAIKNSAKWQEAPWMKTYVI